MDSDRNHHHSPIAFCYCPCCGGNLNSQKLKINQPERLVCQQCSFVLYLDPKVVAGTIISLYGSLVLLKRGIEPSMGKWVFPGGYVDRGESVQDAAIRETKEECNLDVRISSLLGVYSYSNSPNVIVVYSAKILGGELRAADETIEAKTFKLSEIPWDELAFKSTKEALRDYFKND